MIVEQAYGLWSLVIINSLVFIVFAFSFAGPRTARPVRRPVARVCGPHAAVHTGLERRNS
jgi:hypothetical protein